MFEAYQVAVRLSLVNQVSSGLMVIAQGLRQTDREVKNTNTGLLEMENRLKSLKKQALVGGALAAVGGFGLSLFKAPMEAAREYELAFTKFKTLNLGSVVNQQADKFARGAQVMGVSAKELMDTMSESVGLFGSFDAAQRLAPKLARLNVANSALFGGKVDSIDAGSSKALKHFIDRRGGTHDEAAYDRALNLAERMVTGSGGFIQFKDLDQFSQRAGTAFRGLSDAGVLNMALLMQEQGGSAAGTSLMSLYQNLVAGRTPKKTMALLQEFGLGTLSMDTHATVGGKPLKTIVMKDLRGADLLQANPPEWFRTIYLPALAAKGVVSEADILKTTNDLVSNRSGSSQASIMSTQLLQIMRDNKLTTKAMGADQAIAAYEATSTAKLVDLHKRYADALNELGTIALPVVIAGLEKLNSGLKAITQYAQQHPGITKGSIGMFGVLSVAASAGGAIMLARAGFGALAVVMGGTGTAMGGASLVGALGATLGPLGLLVGGVVALGAAAGGLSWLANLIGPDKKIDGANHDRQHWVDGKGPRGSGGYWEGNHRVISRAGQTWRPNRGGSGGFWADDNHESSPSSYVRPRGSSPMRTINNTIVMPNGQVLAKVVTQEQAKSLNRPATGATGFDTSMAPAGFAVTGVN